MWGTTPKHYNSSKIVSRKLWISPFVVDRRPPTSWKHVTILCVRIVCKILANTQIRKNASLTCGR